jgi:hypothetical protein
MMGKESIADFKNWMNFNVINSVLNRIYMRIVSLFF